jgi:hypothetical protein
VSKKRLITKSASISWQVLASVLAHFSARQDRQALSVFSARELSKWSKL